MSSGLRWTEEEYQAWRARHHAPLVAPPPAPAGRMSPPARYMPPATLDPDIRELPFMEAIRMLARHQGWLCFHAYSSRKSEPGFPDLCLVRGTSLLFAELKDATGQPSLEQTEWLYALEYGGYEAYLWRPQDWPEITERLTRSQ